MSRGMARKRRLGLGAVALIALVSVADTAPAADGGHNHSHDDHGGESATAPAVTLAVDKFEHFQWAALVATPEDWYMLKTQKVGTPPGYADVALKLALLPAPDSSKATLTALQHEGDRALEHSCTAVEFGDVLVPRADFCYLLRFDLQSWQTLFRVNTTANTNVAIFSERSPLEFARDKHYLQDRLGRNVEATHVLTSEQGDDAHSHDVSNDDGHGHADDESHGDDHGHESHSGGDSHGHADTHEHEDEHGHDDDGHRHVNEHEDTHEHEDDHDHVDGHEDEHSHEHGHEHGHGAHGDDGAHGDEEEEPLDYEAYLELLAQMANEQQGLPWGDAIGVALLVNAVTLSGVIFLLPCMKTCATRDASRFEAIVSGFAAGAILSCAFFLMLYEATHLISATYGDEVETVWRWGTMILAGFVSCSCVNLLVGIVTDTGVRIESSRRRSHAARGRAKAVPRIGETPLTEVVLSGTSTHTNSSRTGKAIDPFYSGNESSGTSGGGGGGGHKHGSAGGGGLGCSHGHDTEIDPRQQKINAIRVCAGVLLGDFMHNLVDGVFIGAAFKNCSRAKALSVAIATIAHEVSHELSDYVVLTGQGGLRPVTALALNFASGISIVFGVIAVFAGDVSECTQGMLLAFGGGVFLHIAAVECMTHAYAKATTTCVRLAAMLAFVIGAVSIGLVLFDHEHCVSHEHGGHAHGGHASEHAGELESGGHGH